MTWPKIKVAKVISDGVGKLPSEEYFIIEVYLSSEGPRTRVSGSRPDETTAQAYAQLLRSCPTWEQPSGTDSEDIGADMHCKTCNIPLSNHRK